MPCIYSTGPIPVEDDFGQTAPVVTIPDPAGLSAHIAALAYADAGLWVLPVATGKHPGSVVGDDWPALSTRDPDVIEAYWDRPDPHGIALHMGRSGLVAVDLDIDVIPDELAWLRKGLFQSSRGGRGERGHYVFATAEVFRNVKIYLSDGTHVGEIKTGNAVILVEPSPHPKTDDGGKYVWQQTGEVPELPDEGHAALAALSTKAGGCDAGSISDETVLAWCERHTDEIEPRRRKVLRENYTKRVKRGESRHDAMMAVLGWAAREIAPGLIAATVLNDLHDDWIASYRATDQSPQRGDFTRMLREAVGKVAPADDDPALMADLLARGRRDFGTNHKTAAAANARDADALTGWLSRLDTDTGETAKSQRPRFVGVSAAELAAPVQPMRWLVRGVWPQRSAGVLAGEKKTFKTWNLQALALAVSAGVPFLGQFDVPDPGPVLYLCGEGGRDAFANRHQVIAKRYGIATVDLTELAFVADFDTDELTSAELIDGVQRHLDNLQPSLVILDPLYAYHPANVEASNLYARGPMLAKIRELVEHHAALIIGDHFKKGTADGFDLDHISMAGVAQWADTWALQRHRTDPDLANNDYRIEVEFSTRRGGGRRWHIDWHLDRDPDPDLVAWTAADWSVIAAGSKTAATPARDLELRVLAEVAKAPWTLNRTALAVVVGGRKKAVVDAVNRLLDSRELSERDPADGARSKAMVLGPGKVVASGSGGAS